MLYMAVEENPLPTWLTLDKLACQHVIILSFLF
jgi:hypothetical protein